jgi:cyclohexyl-isocyanide hydratase
MSEKKQIGLLVFPNITQLDMTGPLQVFGSVADADVHLLWKTLDPVSSDTPLVITPTMTLADCPQLDLICVPGGLGTNALMEDGDVLDFLRRQAEGASYVTSVCTGALVLGAAGLLKGYKATTHWNALSTLPILGAEVVRERVVVDRNRITGGGVTAGIDLGLMVVAEMFGRAVAEFVQLRLEYNPQPPFNAGSPDSAPAEVLSSTQARMAAAQQTRIEIAKRIAPTL